MARFGIYSIGGELVGVVTFDGPMHMQWASTVLERLIDYDKVTCKILPKLELRKFVSASDFDDLIERGARRDHFDCKSRVLPRGVLTVRADERPEVYHQVYRLLEWVNRVQDFEVSNPRLSAEECVHQAYEMIGE